MASIKIDNNGDIVLDSLGKVVFIKDNEEIIQSLILKLRTLKGELFYNLDYGHPKMRGKQDSNSIENYLKDTLMDDDRIIDIEVINFKATSLGSYKVDVNIQLDNGEEMDLNLLL